MKRFIFAAVCATAIFLPTVASAGEVHNREVRQNQRIYNGVRNGSINRAELRNLKRRQAALEAARRRNLLDGGRLTPRERRRLNQQQNNFSRTIYRYKRN
ncbi:MAG: hypothetical protein KME21_03105 [Desmonostoc vinosum HA7617-LM4]|jgi:hypothetical protein|nr:hypothetical protein [Desmonostoc vinosum HA7617-LM4]